MQISWFFSALEIFTIQGTALNNKISFLLSFLVNSRSFFPTFHKLLTIFFSLYLSFFWSYSTGCFFAFLHNKPTFQKMGEGWGRGDKVKKIKFTGNIQIKSTNLQGSHGSSQLLICPNFWYSSSFFLIFPNFWKILPDFSWFLLANKYYDIISFSGIW